MSYYDDNNKIRRKKVSSSNSNSRTTSRQNTSINRSRIKKSDTYNNRKREVSSRPSMNKNSRKQVRKKRGNKKLLGFIKKLLIMTLVLGFVASIASTVLINIALKDSPPMTYSYLKENL